MKFISKKSNMISVTVLFLMIGFCYLLWLVGIDSSLTSELYNVSSQVITWGTIILFCLNIQYMEKMDWCWIVIGGLSFLFYQFFTTGRQADFYKNLQLWIIILLVLSIKKITFSNTARNILIGLGVVVIMITLYRVFTEIPDPPKGQTIWKGGNWLKEIWINSNTIGSSLMTAMLLSVSLLKLYHKKRLFLLIVLIEIASLIGIWVVQSKACLYASIIFIILDNLPKRIFLSLNHLIGIIYTIVIVGALPLSYFFSNSDKYDLFTGREEIWKKFYEELSLRSSQIFVGMKPFFFNRNGEILGHHNSYNAVLAFFGIIGLLIFIGFILFQIWQKILGSRISYGQYTCFFSFLVIILQSFMEDTLLSTFWFPLIYIFLGWAINESINGPLRQTKRSVSINFDDHKEQITRSKKYHLNRF